MPEDGWYGTTRFGSLCATGDGGRSWHEVSVSALRNGFRTVMELHFVTPERGYLVTLEEALGGSRLLVTEDGGARWETRYPAGR